MPATIRFGQQVDASRIPPHALAVVERLLTSTGNPACLVTSAARDPEAQARIMLDNLEKLGVTAQRKLYKAPGQKVIDTYALVMGRAPSAAIIRSMAQTIRDVGPSNVSLHCADPAKLAVLDIAPSSLSRPASFRAAAEKDAAVSRVLGPPNDPAFHLEIPAAAT